MRAARAGRRQQSQTARCAAFGQRRAEFGGGGKPRADPGDDLHCNSGCATGRKLLIGAPKHHRIAAFQAHHTRKALRGRYKQAIYDGLIGGGPPGAFADGDFARLGAQFEDFGRHQRVMQHIIGLRQKARGPHRQQVRRAWPPAPTR